MLGNSHYYHRLIRKCVILFGRMFDDISIIRKHDETGEEISRFLVPIIYSPKEKMVTRILSDEDLMRQVQAILPRMGFEITGINYDSTRKQNSLLKTPSAPGGTTTTYTGVPYDITFSLTVYARNIDDCNHILEQIMPFFNPDFTVTTNMVPELGFLKDVPIILNSISQNIEYEGNYDSVRYVYATLNFTMKMTFYGPTVTPKLIRTVYANIYNDANIQSGYITRLNVGSANGVFKMEDMVFQGPSYNEATAYGIVLKYNKDQGKLVLGATQGNFKVNTAIHALSTNGVCTLTSFDVTPLLTSKITVTPDPVDAQPGDDYGYHIDITEWPDTEA